MNDLEKRDLPIIGITCGDLNGIGMEVIMKTLQDPQLMDLCTPVVFASSKVAGYHRKALDMQQFNFHLISSLDAIQEGKPNLLNTWQEAVNLEYGQESEEVGSFALQSIDAAIAAHKSGQIDAVVTAPIHKNTIKLKDRHFAGHTGYLGEETGGDPIMILAHEGLRVGLVTGHLPIRAVAEAITTEKVLAALRKMHHSLQVDFGIQRPKIAVLGLNPHAGDNGLLGEEEQTVIAPALATGQEEGLIVYGPFAADGFFGSGQFEKFDGILAMYHDQGLVAFKTLAFGNGVNVTAGLPLVRTSPDHGTGFDIAGKGIADENSFRQALYMAVDIWRNRSLHEELTANPLKKHRQPSMRGNN
jgi:4-hydroxythreonine-4-phosphate dehydrogenase